MDKKFFISWLILFVCWMFGSFVVHGVLLRDDYSALVPRLFRSPDDAQAFFPLMVIAHILLSGAFVWGSTRAASRRSRGSRKGSASASPWRC